MFDDGAFKPIPHAVAGCRYLPFAVQKQLFLLFAELIVLRTHDQADGPLRWRSEIDPALGGAACRWRLQLIPGLQWTRIRTAEAGTGIHSQAPEHRFASDPALDRQIAE